jgi:hypothetical protein
MVALLLAGEGAPTARPETAGSPDAGASGAAARPDAGAPPPEPDGSKQPPAPPRSAAVAMRAPAPAAETAPAPAAASRGRGDAPPSIPWTLAVETGASASLGELPRLAAAVEGRLWATPGRGPALFAGGSVWRSQRTLVAGSDSSGAELDLWTAGLGLCPLTPHAEHAPAYVACLVGDVGRFGASGFGFVRTRNGRHWIGDAGFEGDVRQRLARRIFLSAGLRLVVPLVRDDVAYMDSASGTAMSIFRVAPVVATAALRLGAVFP